MKIKRLKFAKRDTVHLPANLEGGSLTMEAINFDNYLNISAIKAKTYEISLLTPMAMYGVKGPDLRSSSIRGIMRYWWRAIQYETNIDKLLEREEAFFGGIQKIKGKSKIRINVDIDNLFLQTYKVLPHKDQGSMKMLDASKENKNLLNITTSASINLSDSEWDYYQKILELTLLLSGFGRRTRRGFGAVQWKKHQFECPEDYLEKTSQILTELIPKNNAVNKGDNYIQINYDSYSPPYPVISKIWLGEAYELTEMKKILVDYGEASHIRRGASQDVLGYAKRKERFASPLWGSVKKVGMHLYPVITELHSREIYDVEKDSLQKAYIEERDNFLRKMGVEV